MTQPRCSTDLAANALTEARMRADFAGSGGTPCRRAREFCVSRVGDAS